MLNSINDTYLNLQKFNDINDLCNHYEGKDCFYLKYVTHLDWSYKFDFKAIEDPQTLVYFFKNFPNLKRYV